MKTRMWLVLALAMASAGRAAPDPAPPPGLRAALAYPFASGLVAAARADRIAWIRIVDGVRTVWTAAGPDYRAVAVTRGGSDDGQELTGLTIAPDGRRIAWTRGGDHDANWPAEGDLQPDPASSADQPHLTIWSAPVDGGKPIAIDEGDAPAFGADGRIAYVKAGKVWLADAAGRGKPALAFFDRGSDGSLAWSPDGRRLAFVSRRGDHGFVGVFTPADRTLTWLAPSSGWDETPVWSPAGDRIAFTHRAGSAGAPESRLVETPQPWSIRVADVATGTAQTAWASPRDLNGSFPAVPDGVWLTWAAGDRLVFRAEMDGWPHLYSLPARGGPPLLLTPGAYMVEHVALTRDGTALLYDANTGAAVEDDDRRHVFSVPVDRAAPEPLTRGAGIEWTPVAAAANRVAYVAAGPTRGAEVRIDGGTVVGPAADGYAAAMVVPRRVTFRAADGVLVHAQLFAPPGLAAKRPALVFVHGGPPRQMLLGFPYMDYYAHAYALNQYLAAHGYVVLSVNYRLGIGYGRAFQHAERAGPAGAAEYRDVQAAGRFLQSLAEVDGGRIGIWGGSYGGYLTAMALARDSATFKAGVDLHGVHDWSRLIAEEDAPAKRYEQGDWDAALKTAFDSSPIASMATWRSPVLLIHGDDDRNVRFNQTIDLARRLDDRGVPYEELVLPNEIHMFLRQQDWLKADTALVRFFDARLKR